MGIFCTSCGLKIEDPTQGFFCTEECRQEHVQQLSSPPQYPQHPAYSADAEEDANYYTALHKVTAWYRSAQLGSALAKVIKDNDLAAYLHLEKNYLRCRGLGRKSWSALLEEVGQGR